MGGSHPRNGGNEKKKKTDEFSMGCWAGLESGDGGPREREKKIVGVHPQAWEELRVVVASVAVTLLHVALIILSLVDPIDDVLVAIL